MQILTRFNKVIAYSAYEYIPVGNSAICPDTRECYNDVLIVSVDCVPTDIDCYDYYYLNGKFVKGDSKTELRELNNHNKMQFWVGSQAEYEEIPAEDIVADCLYIITDDVTYVKLGAPVLNTGNKLTSQGYYYIACVNSSTNGTRKGVLIHWDGVEASQVVDFNLTSDAMVTLTLKISSAGILSCTAKKLVHSSRAYTETEQSDTVFYTMKIGE